MNLYIDTNAYSAFKKNRSEAVFIIERAPVIVLSPIVVGELRSGFICGSRARKNEEELLQFISSPRVYIEPIDDENTAVYARVFKQLRQDGHPIPTNDLWIASGALQDDCVLFTYDSHFRYIDGLTVVSSQEGFVELL